MAVAAQPLVSFILSDKWLPCAIFLSLFCILRIPGIITSIDKQVYYSVGKSQIGLYYEIGLLVVNLFSLTLMIPYGVWAIAIGYTVVEFLGNFMAQVRKSVDSPPGMLTEDHHHTVHEESQVCYSSHLRPKSLHL